ncbi:hypothetical protein QYF61_020756 [Mycteria americana]|uniref:Uncharacterized protein n=1 Tax=Mycteria americana TaxID=33587 RepID=A0AAN7MK69_MYCAM|nr:hypothetical protein QYF61_020756 [Mycteria americana]
MRSILQHPHSAGFPIYVCLYLGVTYLDPNSTLSPDRIQVIQNIPQPQTKNQMRAFVGAVGCCRPWIAALGELVKPILNSIHQDQAEPLQWRADQMAAFEKLKRALLAAPALGLQMMINLLPYTYMKEKVPPLGSSPVRIYPLQACRAVAAAAALTDQVKNIVLGHPLEVQVPREVETILTNHVNQAFSPQHLHKYEATPRTADNITLKRCNTLHPASLLPLPHEGLPHHGSIKKLSAQAAQLLALTEACQLNTDKSVNVYIDSCYAFGLCHATGKFRNKEDL